MKKIYFIDDQEIKDIGLVSNKLEDIIKSYNNEVDTEKCQYIPLFGKENRDKILSIQRGDVENESIIFLDANLDGFNDLQQSPLKYISTVKIIESVFQKNCKVIMLSQYEKSDTEYGGKDSKNPRWFDEYHEAGAFYYIRKDDLLKIDISNKESSDYIKIKRLISSIFYRVNLSNYKISLGTEGKGMYAKFIENYSNKELGTINDFTNVSIDNLLEDNIDVIGVNGARIVLFRMMFELALLLKSELIISPKDIYKNFTDNDNEIISLVSIINTNEIYKFNIIEKLINKSPGKGKRKFEVSNIEIEESLLMQYQNAKNKLNPIKILNNTNYENEIEDLKKQVIALTKRCQELESLNPSKINIQNLQNQINKLKG